MRYNKLVQKIFEAIGDVPPPPPAHIQKASDTKLTFDEIYELIKKHEGVRPEVYKDTMGIPTIGIGFNLMRPDAKSILNKLGLNYNDVLNGRVSLTDKQMKEIFVECLNIAYNDAKRYIPSFDSQPKEVKLALIDLSFNLGLNRLNKFVKTREYILNGDYKSAANELKNSRWANQVGNRAKSVIGLFLSVA